jgi:hypothetical protein
MARGDPNGPKPVVLRVIQFETIGSLAFPVLMPTDTDSICNPASAISELFQFASELFQFGIEKRMLLRAIEYFDGTLDGKIDCQLYAIMIDEATAPIIIAATSTTILECFVLNIMNTLCRLVLTKVHKLSLKLKCLLRGRNL